MKFSSQLWKDKPRLHIASVKVAQQDCVTCCWHKQAAAYKSSNYYLVAKITVREADVFIISVL